MFTTHPGVRRHTSASAMFTRVWPPLVVVAVMVAAWEVWVRLADVETSVFPAPSHVALALVDHAGTLTRHAGTTLAETGIGLVVGVAIGCLVAVAIASSSIARRALEPLLVVVQTVPPLVLAPVLVLAFGFGWTPRVVVVVLIVFFPVAVAAAGSFLRVDRDRVNVVRSLGGTRRDIWRYVTVPSALPAIFDGVRISAAYAVAGAAIAEQIGGARSGLGLFVARSQRAFRADQVLAGVVVIALLSLAVYGAVALLARRIVPWHPHPSELTS